MSQRPAFFYTLLAYREDGVDTCRGCVMDRSSSSFEHFVSNDPKEVAKFWANHMFNAPSGREFCQFEYTLLLNGCSEWKDVDEWSEEVDTDFDPESGQRWSYLSRLEVRELTDQELARLNQERAAKLAREAEEAEAARVAQEAKKAADAERAQRAQYERLSAIYGKN